jgi:hypothetical protein
MDARVFSRLSGQWVDVCTLAYPRSRHAAARLQARTGTPFTLNLQAPLASVRIVPTLDARCRIAYIALPFCPLSQPPHIDPAFHNLPQTTTAHSESHAVYHVAPSSCSFPSVWSVNQPSIVIGGTQTLAPPAVPLLWRGDRNAFKLPTRVLSAPLRGFLTSL